MLVNVSRLSLERANETYSENTGAMARISELEDRIYELESQVDVADNKLSNAISPTKYEVQKTYSKNLEQTVHDLKAKLNAIHWHAQRIADHG
jgi:Dynamitin.